MSSPWPGAPASSPFPFSTQSTALTPGNTFAPSPAAFIGNQIAPSPAANPLLAQALLGPNAPGSSSTPAGLWGSSSNMPSIANSPAVNMVGATPFGNTNSPLASFAAAQTPYPGSGTGVPGSAARGGRGDRGVEVSLEEVIRGIDQAKLVLDQMETLLLQRQALEAQVFPNSNGEKEKETEEDEMEVDGSATAREETTQMPWRQTQAALLQAQSEYVQLLSAVTQLSSLSLFGGFPNPLSAASTAPSEPSKAVSLLELSTWAEGRAALEFSRREAVKAGSKAVLEVLKAGKQ